jgi:F-type H+-transporting ATPase subunit gamma
MPTLIDIRRRVRSVKSTQQITRAMKMVAAARLRRAQERIFNARPYARQMMVLLQSLAARAEQRDHPLLAVRPVNKTLLVLVTADRGLCGAFNTNLIRAAQAYLAEHSAQQISFMLVGRKGHDFYRKRPVSITSEHLNVFRKLEFASAESIAREIIELYSTGAVDAVDVIYNEFKSILSQRVQLERYLPLAPIEAAREETLVDYIYEQPPAELFKFLLPHYVEIEIYRALLESQAAELAAKMTAMDTATSNAAELMDSLTLKMNRIRQAAITREIIEVVSGAAAL